MTPQIDPLSRLEGFLKDKLNLKASCGWCKREGVLDGQKLWRTFAIHRWRTDLDRVGDRLRCTVCRRHAVKVEPTTDPPTLDPFPKSEDGWQRLIRRLRD